MADVTQYAGSWVVVGGILSISTYVYWLRLEQAPAVCETRSQKAGLVVLEIRYID